MLSLFSDCLSLSFLPDISKWNNYNEDDINETPDYVFLNRLDNLNCDLRYYRASPKDDKLLNDIDYVIQALKEKYIKLYD